MKDVESAPQGYGLAPGIKSEDLAASTQTAAYRMWRASAVAEWLCAQTPSDLTRACLRGILPRLDPRVADLIFQAVAEQLAANAITQVQAAEVEAKTEEAARQQGAADKALASGLSETMGLA